MNKVPKKKIVLVNFSCAMFSLMDFLTPEDGIKRSRNIGKELPLYGTQNISEERRSHTMI
jgi:hypothetical protein